jgi:PPOX class probable F420-dependent enzyme
MSVAELSPKEKKAINAMRVAHLASADPQGTPHLIPICFHYDGDLFYSVLDQKPKRTAVTNLKRVRNILANPKVALVIDHYQEEWQGLWYVLVNGTAELLYEGGEQQSATAELRKKYPQYRTMDLDTNPVIRITPTNIIRWGHPAGC